MTSTPSAPVLRRCRSLLAVACGIALAGCAGIGVNVPLAPGVGVGVSVDPSGQIGIGAGVGVGGVSMGGSVQLPVSSQPQQ